MARIALSLTVALIGSSFVAAQGKADKKKDSKPAKVTAAQALKDAEHALGVLPQFHLAAQNFQDAYGKPLPTDKGLRGDKPNYLGWRFFLLPFIEQDNLYKFVVTDVPTMEVPGGLTREKAEKDYPSLKKVGSMRIAEYTLPRYGAKDKPETTVWRRVLVKGKPKLFVVVESSERVLWIKSGDDLVLDPDKPLPKGMGGNFSGGFFALCGDGKVRFLEKKLSRKAVVEALTTGKGVAALDTSTPGARKKAVKALKLTGGEEEP